MWHYKQLQQVFLFSPNWHSRKEFKLSDGLVLLFTQMGLKERDYFNRTVKESQSGGISAAERIPMKNRM